MPPGKCHEPPGIPRVAATFLAFGVLGLTLVGLAARGDTPILPPDAAVRLYEAGRSAVQKGRYAEGVEKLTQALATGHTTPSERYGTSRYSVERYDPYYWLGVAYMELGDEAKARENLVKSRSAGPIRSWPEFSDLSTRLAQLERRLTPLVPSPTPLLPSPTPTSAPQEPTPPPTPIVSPAPTITTPTPLPAVPTGASDLDAVLSAIAAADFATAERRLALLRESAPSPTNDLLSAVVLGSRYTLEGSHDASLLAKARARLAAYRKAGGSKRAEETWLSPSLRRLLD